MVPDSAPIVINVAQNDYDAEGYAGRLIFNLIANGTAYDMDGATATFEGGKPDGNAFAYDATIVSASVVRVNLKKQMTNVTGRVVCNLVLKNTDGVVGSFNVWLEVQPSAIAGTDPSQTDIPSLVAEAELAADRAEQAADNAEAWSEHPPYIGLNVTGLHTILTLICIQIRAYRRMRINGILVPMYRASQQHPRHFRQALRMRRSTTCI
jgi:hypothetical protein